MSIGDLCAITAALLWSGSVILMRVAGYQIPPVPLTFFKSTVAVVCLVLLLWALGEPLWINLTAWDYLRLVISAAIGIAVADAMIAAALNRLGASLQALADCVYAPAMACVGFLLFGEVLNSWEMLGGALVVSGVFICATVTAEVKSRKDLWVGILLAASAHIIMALGILMVRDIYREISLAWVTGFRMGVAVLVLFVAVALRHPSRLPQLFLGFSRRDTWRITIPMALLGPFLATLFWIAGFKYLEAEFRGHYTYIVTSTWNLGTLYQFH